MEINTSENRTSLKSRIGIFLVILGFISPLVGLIIPFLGFDKTTTATLVTFFLIGGPEIFLILGGVLAGKEGVLLVKNRVKRLFGLPEGKYPATKTQYTIGVFLLSLWFILVIIPGYVPGFFEIPFVKENLLWISISVDVMLLVAIFGFGGHQMITKLASLLKWDPWELPEKN